MYKFIYIMHVYKIYMIYSYNIYIYIPFISRLTTCLPATSTARFWDVSTCTEATHLPQAAGPQFSCLGVVIRLVFHGNESGLILSGIIKLFRLLIPRGSNEC